MKGSPSLPFGGVDVDSYTSHNITESDNNNLKLFFQPT
jgi:hypothetical protein